MTTTAQLVTTRGTQTIRLPQTFNFPGKTVTLRRTAKGVLVTPAREDMEARRRRFLKLAGSCPDFPLPEPHTTPDIPRDFS